jgi:hypothetical protein
MTYLVERINRREAAARYPALFLVRWGTLGHEIRYPSAQRYPNPDLEGIEDCGPAANAPIKSWARNEE